MKTINKIEDIKIGKTYKIEWEETQQIINVKSIEKCDEPTYKNSYYLNGNQRIDFFDMIITELDD